VFVRNCFKFSRIKSLQKLVDILEDEHGPFVSIQPRLILIDGTVSTMFRATVLCRTARSFENSGNSYKSMLLFRKSLLRARGTTNVYAKI